MNLCILSNCFNQMISYKRLFLVSVILMLCACGYHLRNNNLSHIYPKIDITIESRSLLKRPLTNELLASGVEISENADTKLIIKRDSMAKIVQSVGVNNQVQEYRLEYNVHYTIAESQLKSVQIERDYSFDVQQIGGGQTEELTLRKQLAQDMARAIIRQISALNNQ